MPKKKKEPKKKTEVPVVSRLIHEAAKSLGITRNDCAEKLNIASSTLYGYFKKPPTDIEILIELSQKLGINLLAYYKDHQPFKEMFEAKDAEIQRLEEQINKLKKEKDDLCYIIELQKQAIAAQTKRGQE